MLEIRNKIPPAKKYIQLQKNVEVFIDLKENIEKEGHNYKKTDVVYFDQLLDSMLTQKLVEILFWLFSTFLLSSRGGRVVRAVTLQRQQSCQV